MVPLHGWKFPLTHFPIVSRSDLGTCPNRRRGKDKIRKFWPQPKIGDLLTSDDLPMWFNRPLSRRLDRCDRVIQNESRDPFGGNVYYVTMQITFLTRKFRNKERNLHCDVVHITTKWVSSLTLDCNGVFAIKAY